MGQIDAGTTEVTTIGKHNHRVPAQIVATVVACDYWFEYEDALT